MSLKSKSSFVMLALGALILAGCGLAKMKGDSGNSSVSKEDSSKTSKENSSRATSFTPSSDARKDVIDALRRLNTAYPYRLTETASGTGMPESTRVVEFAAADRSHMKWTGGPGGDIEAISIGDRHYWFSNGKWTAGTVPSMLGYRGEDFAKKLADMVKEVKYVGPETVNGESCHVYTGTFETNMAGQQWTGTAKVWIGAGDGLIHQTDSEYHVATYSGKSHVVYEYGGNIKVEPPQM